MASPITSETDIRYPCIIKFGAEWCPPCVKMAPKFKKITEKLIEAKSKYNFYTVNVDDIQDGSFIEKYNIRSIPRIIRAETSKIYKDITIEDLKNML